MQTTNVNPKILKELGVQPFDVADYLQTDEDIVEYLNQVLSEGDTDELVRAVGYVSNDILGLLAARTEREIFGFKIL